MNSGKVLKVVFIAATAAFFVTLLPDLKRYVKMSMM